MAVVIYGEPGSGKTQYKEQLRKKYNCFQVVDEVDFSQKLQSSILYLTTPRALKNLQQTNVVIIDIKTALKGII